MVSKGEANGIDGQLTVGVLTTFFAPKGGPVPKSSWALGTLLGQSLYRCICLSHATVLSAHCRALYCVS